MRRRSVSQHSTGLSHDERAAATRKAKPELVVLSLDEVAALSGVARRTIERGIAAGEGPTTVDLSPRRRGVTEPDYRIWIKVRRRPTPGLASE
jgi:predicted DNA-binding transcriptional regulator AlpA